MGSLSIEELGAVAAIWRRGRRELTTAFTGTSMLPAIAPGQQVIVDCGADPAVGEVAVFHFDSRVGVHRVVACGTGWLLTWGDANPLPDIPVAPRSIIGSVRGIAGARYSRRRALLLRLILVRGTSMDRLSGVVRLLYRVRSAWTQGPSIFFGKAVRAVLCHTPLR